MLVSDFLRICSLKIHASKTGWTFNMNIIIKNNKKSNIEKMWYKYMWWCLCAYMSAKKSLRVPWDDIKQADDFSVLNRLNAFSGTLRTHQKIVCHILTKHHYFSCTIIVTQRGSFLFDELIVAPKSFKVWWTFPPPQPKKPRPNMSSVFFFLFVFLEDPLGQNAFMRWSY